MVPATSVLPADPVVNVSLDESGSVIEIVPETLPASVTIEVLSPELSAFATNGTGYDDASNDTEPRFEAIVETVYMVESPPVASTES